MAWQRDVGKVACVHRCLRTRASASLKAGAVFVYQAVGRSGAEGRVMDACARSVTREKRPSSAGVVRALARSDHWRSRLDAQMRPHRAEGDREVPAEHEPRENLRGRGVAIRAEEGRRHECALRVAHEDSADGDRRQAGMGPDGGLRDDLDEAVRLAVPTRQAHSRPRGGRIISALFER